MHYTIAAVKYDGVRQFRTLSFNVPDRTE